MGWYRTISAMGFALFVSSCGGRERVSNAQPTAQPTVACGDPTAGPRMVQDAQSAGLEAVTIPVHQTAPLDGTLVSVQQVEGGSYISPSGRPEVGPRAYLVVTQGPHGLVETGRDITILQKTFRVAYIYAPPPTCPAMGQPPSPESVTLVEQRSDMPPGPGPTQEHTAPAVEYGALSPEECVARLQAKGIAHTIEPKPATGVAAPLRLTGPLNGVTIRPLKSTFDILDCRLALALDDFTTLLASHGITGVIHASMYRPGAVIAHQGTPSQHGYGLAIDVAALVKADGSQLNVTKDWSGSIGDEVCPAGWKQAPESKAATLRSIVCEAGEREIFNVILTPNANADHRTHFHLDLSPGAGYFILD